MRAGAEILWFCPPSRPDPVAESQSNYILESEEFNPPRESCDVFDQSNYILESEEFNHPRESFDQSSLYDPQPQVSLIPFFFLARLTGIGPCVLFIFSGSFKPGIFFGDVVSIYYKKY